jgi:RND family efflux transporter MFP subunit
MRFRVAAATAAAVVGLLSASGVLRAHEGHDHGEQAATSLRAVHTARGEAASEAFELVAVVQRGELSIYLDRFTTNEPVDGARIEVETPAGAQTAVGQAGAPYKLSGAWLAKPGQVDLILTITAGDTTDILPVSLTIPEPQTAATATPARSGSVRTADVDPLPLLILGGIGFLGFFIGLGVAGRRRGANAVLAGLGLGLVALALTIGPAFAHEGHDHGALAAPLPSRMTGELAQRLADGTVFVPKATQRIFAVRTIQTEESVHRRSLELPGRVIPDPNASGLVQAAVGGRISPPQGGFPRLGAPVETGAVLAYVTPPLQAIDVSDMRQRQGELDQQIAIVKRRLTRFETLAPAEAVSRAQLEETRLELQGLKERRGALDRVNQNPEPLVAPVSGVVADANAVAGQMAQPDSVVFQIVDPARMWVEALSFERIDGAKSASAKTGAGRDIQLTYRGAGYADRNQSVPVHFSVEGDGRGLRPGQFVTVFVAIDEETRGIAVPRSSVVRSANGQSVVFDHSAAEIFKPVPVRIAALDGERVLVLSGLKAGARVVTQGAELLDQVR